MKRRSAGILPYRFRGGQVHVLLVHPGGPFWAGTDLGTWSIAKGEYREPESALEAAVREFHEETGHRPMGAFRPLSRQRLKSGKVIDAWATEDDWDLSTFVSNTFTMEYPKGSGLRKTFPEVDGIEWFDLATAMRKIHAGQLGFLIELSRMQGHEP